ncbi:MAG TPA: rhamnan synthesis F family protein [Caldimonas sp.]
MSTFEDSFRTWRRRLKASLPYVRRRELRVLQRKYAELIEAIDVKASPASDAALLWIKAFPAELEGDVCLFVTFADEPRIKPHALEHLAALVAARVRVVVIVNTDVAVDRLAIDGALLERASGVVIRQNIGFDFGAWAHVLTFCGDTTRWTRLFLVNDSIVGPLNESDFARLLERIRNSGADVIGLTEALAPLRHLQSYFLVFGARALQGGAVRRIFGRMRNWPTKVQVIDVCETRLTALFEAEGLRCEALFPSLSGDPRSSDDTSVRWAELVRQGFPYLKTRVIAAHPHDPRIKAWLAARPGATPPPSS